MTSPTRKAREYKALDLHRTYSGLTFASPKPCSSRVLVLLFLRARNVELLLVGCDYLFLMCSIFSLVYSPTSVYSFRVTKSEPPEKKDLLQRQAAPEEERPLAQVISHAHNKEAEKLDQELVTDVVKDDSRRVSDEIDKKQKRKEEKRAAKELRREEKKAAKKVTIFLLTFV